MNSNYHPLGYVATDDYHQENQLVCEFCTKFAANPDPDEHQGLCMDLPLYSSLKRLHIQIGQKEVSMAFVDKDHWCGEFKPRKEEPCQTN